MIKKIVVVLSCILIIIASCRKNNNEFEVKIPDFNFPQTISFESKLSAYNIFEGKPSNLTPTKDYEHLELSSVLFTDYAHKQRLIKVPTGTKLNKLNDGSLLFPEGTILTKTFFYYKDERDTTLGKQIIETRLLIKDNGIWNVATYLWNENQTDATLKLNGHDIQVAWINSSGNNRSTRYHLPTQNECMTCHQSNATMQPLGTKLRNLNRNVNRNGSTINQLSHLQSIGILNNFPTNQIHQMVDYNDENVSLSERGRAYLDINCAHCHNPNAWGIPAEKDFDFRQETSIGQSGIIPGQDEITRNISNGEMPFIGTTMIDEEGVELLIEYLESL